VIAMLIPSQAQSNSGGFVCTWEDRAELVPGVMDYRWVESATLSSAPTAARVSRMAAKSVADDTRLTGAALALLSAPAGATFAIRKRRRA
jgi:hypothetical protein